jgi:hypothetical protein
MHGECHRRQGHNSGVLSNRLRKFATFARVATQRCVLSRPRTSADDEAPRKAGDTAE